MKFRLFEFSGIPPAYHSNFKNLYLDIAWFGVLSGTAINFLNIYATRLGASGFQIGLLTATSAVVNLFLALPAGHWISKRPTARAVFWSSVLFRTGYLLFIPLPWLFHAQGQIWALILITFFMAIPLTPLGVGFNALFAEAVPERFRAQVAGTRNITFAIAYLLTSLAAGAILQNTPFPTGYQIVFAIGTFGAAMSSYHIYHVRANPDHASAPLSAPAAGTEKRADSSRGIHAHLRLDIWKTRFKPVLLGLFFFHFTQYLAIPVYPLYNINVLNLNDDHIGNGMALYYLSTLMASTQLGNIVQKYGHKKVTGWGAMGIASYPIMLAFSETVWHFYMLSFLGGFLFALVNGAYANYMLENIPTDDRPSHLAWYTMVFNLAVLASSILGPLLADQMGLVSALLLFGVLRFLAGVTLLRYG